MLNVSFWFKSSCPTLWSLTVLLKITPNWQREHSHLKQSSFQASQGFVPFLCLFTFTQRQFRRSDIFQRCFNWRPVSLWGKLRLWGQGPTTTAQATTMLGIELELPREEKPTCSPLLAFPRPLSTAPQDGSGWKEPGAHLVPPLPWRDTLHSPGCSKLALLPILEEECKGDAIRDSVHLLLLLANRFYLERTPGSGHPPALEELWINPTALRWSLPVQPAGTEAQHEQGSLQCCDSGGPVPWQSI